MCTAISYRNGARYFGRNLDLEGSFGEGVTITPRRAALRFRRAEGSERAFAMIGMAIVRDGFPLYFDAVNERGLGMAGLNFPKNAVYHAADSEAARGKTLVAPFEIIPYVLGRCSTVSEARDLLAHVCLIDEPFAEELPLTPLHWMIAGEDGSLVVEPREDGLYLYDDPVDVLTNNPPFPMQLQRLNDYLALSPEEPENAFAKDLPLAAYSRGMGAMGLPGDCSSASRFVRAAFTLKNCRAGEGEEESLAAFFHILGSVAMTRGCVRLRSGLCEETVYSCCCNAERGIYYYTVYSDPAVKAVDLFGEDLDGVKPVFYPLQKRMRIEWQNGGKDR